jgi:hypothetical protein
VTDEYDAAGVLRLKSGELLLRLRETLEKIDSSSWPTPGSETARKFMLEVIATLEAPKVRAAASPSVYLQVARNLDPFVEAIARSSTRRISWPLVTYCNKIWTASLPSAQATPFYTVLDEYNYELEFFSEGVLDEILPVVPLATVTALQAKYGRIYCVKVARLEDANLSLYGLLGHEIGHALWHENRTDLTNLVLKAHEDLFNQAFGISAAVGTYYGSLVLAASEELFCDLFASRAIGPAYAFNCMEFTAGDAGLGDWNIVTRNGRASAHPSWAFRCLAVHERLGLSQFVAGFDKEASSLQLKVRGAGILRWHEELKGVADRARVEPSSPEGQQLVDFLEGKFEASKAATMIAIAEVEKHLKLGAPLQPGPRDIAALAERVSAGILPNIVPDGTLLGKPADFISILACTTIYRNWLLTSLQPEGPDLLDELDRVDRFTAKAMEVAYIQERYRGVIG